MVALQVPGSKDKLPSLGTYPEVSLKAAREERDKAGALLRSEQDPAEQRKAAKREKQLAADNSFECVAREFIAKQRARRDEDYETGFPGCSGQCRDVSAYIAKHAEFNDLL
jgi:Arm DNA-binding domain